MLPTAACFSPLSAPSFTCTRQGNHWQEVRAPGWATSQANATSTSQACKTHGGGVGGQGQGQGGHTGAQSLQGAHDGHRGGRLLGLGLTGLAHHHGASSDGLHCCDGSDCWDGRLQQCRWGLELDNLSDFGLIQWRVSRLLRLPISIAAPLLSLSD